MPAPLALSVCVLFIFWLLARDRKWQDRVSIALWIPVLWALIIGSRPISVWLDPGAQVEDIDMLEGSPLDRYVFLLLIVAALVVLWRRQTSWRKITTNNRWLCVFFLYLGLSVLWSDYPFVSFKRWIKDLGNPMMVLVIFTENDPVAAAKAVMLRCAYILIPLSVLFIRYFPDLGRYYDHFTWQYAYSGVSTTKNGLGMTLLVSGFFLFCRWLELRDGESGAWHRTEAMIHLALLLMTGWLLLVAHCATALVCTVLAACIIVGLKFPGIRVGVKWLGVYSVVIGCGLVLLYMTFGLGDSLVQFVGRDATLTGRTDIWQLVLKANINPVIGAGYYSFWLGGRDKVLSESNMYSFKLNEAHNGYLETYLNSGVLGLFLLIVMLLYACGNIRRKVVAGAEFGDLRLALFIVALAYNLTESAFNRLNLIWFVLLMVIMRYPRPFRARSGDSVGLSDDMVNWPQTERTPADSIGSDVSSIG
jgi:exopolysaccharide production protein ExoQ